VVYSLLALVRGTQAVVLLRGIIFVVIVVVLLTPFLELRAFSGCCAEARRLSPSR
jgi:hypothetical protein